MLSFSIEYEVINKAKIVEGVDRKPDRGTIHGLEYSPPSDIYGPESLFFLNGLCFSTPIDRYIYHVCPFQNITQTRVNGNTKGTLLGVWGDWIENGYSKMKYHKGQSCSRSDRSVIVDIACGQNIFGLIPETVQEIESCEYHMTFAMPIACRLLFEGRVALKEVEFATQVKCCMLLSPQITSLSTSTLFMYLFHYLLQFLHFINIIMLTLSLYLLNVNVRMCA